MTLTIRTLTMHAGIATEVTGDLWAGDHRWFVSVLLYKDATGHLRTDSPWRLHAHIPANRGPHRPASRAIRQVLLDQVYKYVDGTAEHDPTVSAATNNPKGDKHMELMNAARCAIYTKYGKGPQCPKLAAIGSDICSTHKYLEAKLGPLPRQQVVSAPVVEAAPVVDHAPIAVLEPALMAARASLGTIADSFAATAPVETSAPVAETAKNTRKARSDKGKSRSKKS